MPRPKVDFPVKEEMWDCWERRPARLRKGIDQFMTRNSFLY